MGTGDSPRPTDAELAILNVLWAQGACTVRDVHERLSQERDMGYTTVLKLMQIMFEKGLVTRDDSQRSHVYKARQKEQTTQLVMQALSAKKASKEELAEIRRLLNELEGGAP
jgi:predicted transcriptional regulator